MLLAATPSASLTADNGTLTSGATKQACTGSSDGNCVMFGGQQASVPKHVETWAYDDSTLATYPNGSKDCNGGYDTNTKQVQQWLSYAEVACGIPPPSYNGAASKASYDCHASGVSYCKVIDYVDPNIMYPSASSQWNGANGCGGFNSQASESWFLHNPGGAILNGTSRLYQPQGATGYYDNISNPSVQSYYQRWVQCNFDADDGLFVDDTAAGLIGAFGDSTYCQQAQVQQSGTCSSQEITSSGTLQKAHEDMANLLTHKNGSPFLQVNNGIGANPYQTSSIPLYNNPSSVIGQTSEGVPIVSGKIIIGQYFESLLDNMSWVDNTFNDFIVILSEDSAGSSTQSLSRRVQAATDWLGYSPGHIVSWSDFEGNNTNLAIWPEEGIYPTQPVQSMGVAGNANGQTGCFAASKYGSTCTAGGHNNVQISGAPTDVFRREFKQCYNQGKAFGACASIVNDSGSPVTISSSWLTQSYSHQITMVGGDVQSGGTVNLTGASFSPGSTTIPAGDAMLLTP